MGGEGFGTGHDVTMMYGSAWMINGNERHVNDELEMGKSPGPPNSPSAGDNGS